MARRFQMNKLLKNFFILILAILFIMAFSSSYFSLSMDNLAYVLAIGIVNLMRIN